MQHFSRSDSTRFPLCCAFRIRKKNPEKRPYEPRIFAKVDDLFDNVDQYFSNFLESFVFVSVFVFVFFHVLL